MTGFIRAVSAMAADRVSRAERIDLWRRSPIRYFSAEKVARALDLALILNLPPRHPDRMIAAQVVLYIGLAIFIATTHWQHSKAVHLLIFRAALRSSPPP
jgi:hypothetical protein